MGPLRRSLAALESPGCYVAGGMICLLVSVLVASVAFGLDS